MEKRFDSNRFLATLDKNWYRAEIPSFTEIQNPYKGKRKSLAIIGGNGVGKSDIASTASEELSAKLHHTDNPAFALYRFPKLIKKITGIKPPDDILQNPEVMQYFHLYVTCKDSETLLEFLRYSRMLSRLLISEEDKFERKQVTQQEYRNTGWETEFTYIPKQFNRIIIGEGYSLLDRDTLKEFDAIAEISTHPQQVAWDDVARRQNILDKNLTQFMKVMEIAGSIADDRKYTRGLNAFQVSNNFIRNNNGSWIREKSKLEVGQKIARIFNCAKYEKN